MLVKKLSEKLDKRNKSKLSLKEAEYIKYKEQVESARIEAVMSLISEFNSWSRLSEEEEDQLDNIIQDLKNYLDLLFKINEELKVIVDYLERE